MVGDKWVLKLLGDGTSKARYVLRGFEEDVEDEDVFAITTLTASVRMLLSLAVGRKNEGYTVFSAGVEKAAFFNARMKDGDVVSANPLVWSPETLDSNVGTVVWDLGERPLWIADALQKRWQEQEENALMEAALCQINSSLVSGRSTYVPR